jgi:transcriptional regulator with XRE-family HTH domain
MGRTPKNQDHVLVRLRRAISTPSEVITRKKLAQRIGVSASTIRDIETDKFGLTEAIASRLMTATMVNKRSLLNGDDPLKDITGKDLGPNSNREGSRRNDPYHEFGIFKLMETALRAADKMKRSEVFYELFNEWLPAALEAINATDSMKKILESELGKFDPGYVPDQLWPTQPKMKRRWKEASENLILMVAKDAEPVEAESMKKVPPKASIREKLELSDKVVLETYKNALGTGRFKERMFKPRSTPAKRSS